MALAGTCTQEGGPEIGEFTNTTPTGADMIAIIERHGEWREKKARSILRARNAFQIQKGKLSLTRLGGNEERNLYNTGASFTAQFWAPRSQRCTLKESGEWSLIGFATREQCTPVSGTRVFWTQTKPWNIFFSTCQEAGPERCSFSTTGGNAS